MKMIADLHIHSRFSMATSKEGMPESPQRCICKRRKPEVPGRRNTFCCLRGNQFYL